MGAQWYEYVGKEIRLGVQTDLGDFRAQRAAFLFETPMVCLLCSHPVILYISVLDINDLLVYQCIELLNFTNEITEISVFPRST